MQVQAISATAAATVATAVRTEQHDDKAHSSADPPFNYLPSTRQVLSELTPADRSAIEGATGFRLSPSGEIINPGLVPPWTFILAFAQKRSAERASASDTAPPAESARIVPVQRGSAEVDMTA